VNALRRPASLKAKPLLEPEDPPLDELELDGEAALDEAEAVAEAIGVEAAGDEAAGTLTTAAAEVVGAAAWV
jgi:hypothetical protein